MSVTLETGGVPPAPALPLPDWQVRANVELLDSHYTDSWITRRMWLVGSTAVNGVGNDLDVVIEHGDLDDAVGCLCKAGWEVNSAEVYRGINSDGWFSARKGDVNLLVSDETAIDLWLTANRVCIEYASRLDRPTTRDERVAFHRAVFND